MNSVKFSDEVIAKVAQVLQVAILSGTDIVDNLRAMRLVVEGDELVCDPDFLETFEQNIQTMMAEVAPGESGV
tara:strand:- start:226 stop:444 length:219 start_codon:yes stop_codon:yes gene_type:complete